VTYRYRLRVVPSSEGRMASLLERLASDLAWGGKGDAAFCRARDSHLTGPFRWARCARLLIRWQMWAHFHAGVAWAPLVGVRPHVYAQFWENIFGRWPGDDVARGQMEDE